MGVNNFIQVGSRIKQIRIDKGLTQKDVAEKLNIPVSTYANYENNNREPNSNIIKGIADVLNVSVDVLITDNEVIKTLAYIYKFFNNFISDKQMEEAGKNALELLYAKKDAKEVDLDLLTRFSKDMKMNIELNMNPSTNESDIFFTELSKYYSMLNDKGKEKALENIEILSKVSEFIKKPGKS